MGAKRKEQNSRGVTAGDDLYELRLRKDGDGFDLINDSFQCGAIWYSGPDAVRVLDASGAVVQTYESIDDFRQ